MNKVEILNGTVKETTMANMKEGDVAVIIGGPCSGQIVQKIVGGRFAFSFSNYEYYWDAANRSSIPVRVLPSGTEIKITVG